MGLFLQAENPTTLNARDARAFSPPAANWTKPRPAGRRATPRQGGKSLDQPSSIGARLDRLPSSWPVWRLIVLISLGGLFEFYDLMMTAYISPSLVAAGVFHQGARGLFGLTD